MANTIKPIKTKKVSELIYEQLKDLIFQGRFKPGQKIPPERELAESFGVSRPSVKSAIEKLVNMGFLLQRQGRGTFVTPYETRFLKNPLRDLLQVSEHNLVDLLEVRLGLESQGAALAAKRATDDDVQRLETCVRDIMTKIKMGDAGADEDTAFHMGIAYATKNSAQIYLMKSFYDLLFYGIRQNLFYLAEAGNLPVVAEQHAEIFQCIARRDPERAKKAMADHIQYVIDFSRKQNL